MIPFTKLDEEYECVRSEVTDAVTRVLESGWYVLGDEVTAFEDEFSSAVGTAHGVGVNSGTDALYLALRALGVETGDEVVTVSHSFVSTADAIVRNGATPVFVDVDPETYTMDPDAFAEAVSRDTKAVVPVHLYGQPADMAPILEVAREHDVAVVEDACQAHGATYDERPAGSIGDIGCFSFYPTKNLGAFGDGGIAVTDDPDLADRMRTLRNLGSEEKYRHEAVGLNSRLDELQAAVLREKLPHLDDWNARRRSAAERYDERLAESADVTTPTIRRDRSHVYHLYVVRHPDRERLRARLDSVARTLVHYPVPIHRQPPYREFTAPGELTVTERVTNEVVSLPMSPWLTEAEVDAVCDALL